MTTKPVRELLHSGWYAYEPVAELRPPRKGETYFGGYMDFPLQAQQDIPNEYWILTPVKTQAKTETYQV